MRSNNLDKYVKGGTKETLKSTSVSITTDQDKFVKKHGINLSMFLRDRLDEVMAKAPPSKKKASAKR